MKNEVIGTEMHDWLGYPYFTVSPNPVNREVVHARIIEQNPVGCQCRACSAKHLCPHGRSV